MRRRWDWRWRKRDDEIGIRVEYCGARSCSLRPTSVVLGRAKYTRNSNVMGALTFFRLLFNYPSTVSSIGVSAL